MANHQKKTSKNISPIIGLITALPVEYAAVKTMLDNHFEYHVSGRGAGRKYLVGDVPAANGNKHQVILSPTLDIGNNSAAARATLLLEHFPTMRFVIMVGVAGGVPYPTKPDDHVRLGDVVVSDHSGVIQYDFVKEERKGKKSYQVTARHRPRPPSATLLEIVGEMKVGEIEGRHPWLDHLNRASNLKNTARPPAKTDVLVDSEDENVELQHPADPDRTPGQPRIFTGPIASSNTLQKNALKRDALRDRYGVKAIEMEGAGIADGAWSFDEVGYLIVRGICDYSDSRKDEIWRGYAAVVAAAYTRALLEVLPANQSATLEKIPEENIKPIGKMLWNTAVMRELLMAAFDDEELTALAFDQFFSVYENFAVGMTKRHKIQLLLDHCSRRGQIADLLTYVRQRNPYQYKRFQNSLDHSDNEDQGNAISVDGQPVDDSEGLHPPSSEFNTGFIEILPAPGGAIRPSDKLYIKRQADNDLARQLAKKQGTTTVIRAPRQTGKSSLLLRGLHYAREQGLKVVYLAVEEFMNQLTSFDIFLQALAEWIVYKLELEEELVENAWEGGISASMKLSRFVEKSLLSTFDEPVIIAIDEADSLLGTDFYRVFFGLLRGWHNRRAESETWNKLHIILVISTEPYLLIDDLYQSPFNVADRIWLTDFDEIQVRDLIQKHHLQIPDSHLSQMMMLLNGHPFLTRQALYKMVTQKATWPEIHRNAVSENGPFGSHLHHHYWLVSEKPALRKTLKEIINTSSSSDQESIFRLLKAGLISGSGNSYACRCGLYELYFKGKL